jgi:hypothetical protein
VDALPEDIPTLNERITRLEATVQRLRARANTTDEVLEILLTEDTAKGNDDHIVLGMEEKANPGSQ